MGHGFAIVLAHVGALHSLRSFRRRLPWALGPQKMTYYVLEPEVTGGLGELTELDASRHPPIVYKLEYIFDGWLGDSLIESFPCFIVTNALAKRIVELGLTGFSLGEVCVRTSPEFVAQSGNASLQSFRWLQPNGFVGRDDVALASGNRLVVSQRALAAFKAEGLAHCSIEQIDT